MLRARVVIADDHPIVAEGLGQLLRDHHNVVGVVNCGSSLMEIAREVVPDVIVTDLSMPDFTGLEAMRQLKKEGLKSHVIFLTMHSEPHLAAEVLEAGAAGYLPKVSAGEELLTAIQEVLKGRIYLSPTITSDLLSNLRSPRSKRTKLTPRQRQVLRLVAEGRSMKEIGSLLKISTRTVETYKYEMMQSLGIRTTAQLIRYAIQNGLDI